MSARLAFIARYAREVVSRPGGGHALLAELSRDGWFVWERAAFAGDGLLIGACHALHGEVRERHAYGANEVAVEILEEALTLSSEGRLQ